jgi:glycosyltransferase involved in cell wall biosynthesis
VTNTDNASASALRVLVINPISELGGAERVLLDFIASTRIASPGISFHVLTFADGALRQEVERLGASASVLTLPGRLAGLGDSGLLATKRRTRNFRLLAALLRSLPAVIGFVRSLRQEILKHSPDIVHSNGIKAHLLSTLATPRHTPLVWHIHDFLSERPLAGRLLRLGARARTTAVATSEAVAKDTRGILPSLPVVTILNAVDVEEFSPGAGDGSWLDTLSGLPSAPLGTLRIGLVATYAKWKGQAVFMQAAKLVRMQLPAQSLRFYLVGGPLYATHASQFSTDELRALISQLSLEASAGLIPFQRRLPAVFRSLDVVVHASTRPEPFGRSIVEAMACGRAVVVASAGAVTEIVEPGVTGLMHQPGDVTGLAHAISTLVQSEAVRSQLSVQARRAAVSKFSRDRIGPALLTLYRSLL